MAQYQNLRGLYKNLPAQSVDGAIYWTLDGTILMGIEGGAYKEYGSVTTVANKEALPESASPAMLFYIESDNVLAKYDEATSAYVQINKDSDTTYEFARGDNEGELKIVAKDKSGKQVGEPVVVSVVDVAGLNDSIAEAKAAGDKGIEDAAAVAERVGVIEGDYLKKADKDELAAVDAGQETRIATLEAVVGSLTGDEEGGLGSITESIQSAINELDVTDTAVEGQFVTKVDEVDGKISVTRATLKASDIPEIGQDKVTGLVDAIADAKKAGTDAQTFAEGVNTAFGEYKTANNQAVVAAKKAGDDAQKTIDEYKTENDQAVADALAEAQKKVASVGTGDASVTVAGTSTAPTVAVKLDPAADNAIKLGENGLKVEIGADPEYSIVKAAESGEYAAVYNLTKDGAIVGASINIPKDLVVKSGSVVDGNIVLVLNDETNTEIVIPADSLIEYVTSGSQAGDAVVITVDETTHKVTATITDGTIGLAKLTTELQTEIGKAHVHENKSVLDGITADDVEAWKKAKEEAIAEAGKLDAAMDLRMDAVEEKLATVDEDADVNVIETVKVNGVALTPDENKAVDVTIPTGALASKDKVEETDLADELKAKVHTHANKALLDTYTQTEENLADAVAKKHEHANAEELAKIVSGDKAKWDEAATKATANETAIGGVSDRVSALEEIDHDAYVAADEAVKEYADGVAGTAEQNAKDYADTQISTALEWMSF